MIYLTQGDTGVGLKLTVSDGDATIDLTGTTADFLMEDYVIPASITDALNGVILVPFDAMHTANHGVFKASIRLTNDDGSVEHHPNKNHLYVRIQEGVK